MSAIDNKGLIFYFVSKQKHLHIELLIEMVHDLIDYITALQNQQLRCSDNYTMQIYQQLLDFTTKDGQLFQEIITAQEQSGNGGQKIRQKINISPVVKRIVILYFIIRSIIVKCWKQTHNNLFNFNLTDAQLNTQIINIMLKKVRIVKLGDQYQALLPNDPEFAKVMPPVMIDINQLREKDKFGEKMFTFQINEFPKISKPFWLVVKSLPSQRYYLKEGDVFKMGKVKLRVKQIVHKNSQTRDMNKQIVESQFKIYNCEGNVCQGQKDNPDLRCRICMQEAQNSNPLIAICDCIGSSKYTHFKCLRQWFTTQLDPVTINQVTEINWKSLQCQLCKAKLPYSIHLDNQVYFLVQFPKFKKPYLVLNPVYKSNNEKSKIYYFISFKKRNRMIIGRKSDADIQLCTDATISRHHSIIQYVQKNPNLQGRFYLLDNSSKFGTVVLLNAKNSLMVGPILHGLQFQVGGDLIRINYKTANFFHKLSNNEDEIDFNNTQNSHKFVEFAQDEEDDRQEIASESHNKKSSTKEFNPQLISSVQDQYSMANDNLIAGVYTGKKLR